MKVHIVLRDGKVTEHNFTPKRKVSGMKKFDWINRNVDQNAKPIFFR